MPVWIVTLPLTATTWDKLVTPGATSPNLNIALRRVPGEAYCPTPDGSTYTDPYTACPAPVGDYNELGASVGLEHWEYFWHRGSNWNCEWVEGTGSLLGGRCASTDNVSIVRTDKETGEGAEESIAWNRLLLGGAYATATVPGRNVEDMMSYRTKFCSRAKTYCKPNLLFFIKARAAKR